MESTRNNVNRRVVKTQNCIEIYRIPIARGIACWIANEIANVIANVIAEVIAHHAQTHTQILVEYR